MRITRRVTLTCAGLAVALLCPTGATACLCGDIAHWPDNAEVYVVETSRELPTTVVRVDGAGPTWLQADLYTPLPFTVTWSLRGQMSVGSVDTLYWRGGSYLTPSGERRRINESCAVAVAEDEQVLIVVFPFANGYKMQSCATNRVPVEMSETNELGAILSIASADALEIAAEDRYPSGDDAWVPIESIRDALMRRSD
jgi:hypothetical protein